MLRGSGGGTRTRDTTIMSCVLYPPELPRRLAEPPADLTVRREPAQSPFTESNRRPSPYHGDALPTELKGRKTASVRIHRAPTEPEIDNGPVTVHQPRSFDPPA